MIPLRISFETTMRPHQSATGRTGMIKVWSLGIAALVAAANVAAVSAHEPAKTVSASASLAPTALEAAAVVDAFHAALDHGNEVEALALLADDVLIFESGGADAAKQNMQAIISRRTRSFRRRPHRPSR